MIVFAAFLISALTERGFAQQCGLPGQSSRIVGGEEVTSLRDVSSYVSLCPASSAASLSKPVVCAGSLITLDIVMTAAHCFYGNLKKLWPTLYVVVGGMLDRCNSTGCDVRKTCSVRMHPDYNPSTMANDLVMIRLCRPMPSGKMGTLCLIDGSCPLELPRWGTVVGFGTTSYGGSSPCKLQSVVLDILSQEECRNTDVGPYLSESSVCAGKLDGSKDSCQGDSGGGLVVLNGGLNFLAGIVSWGFQCARNNSPGIYQSTCSDGVMGWIREVVDSSTFQARMAPKSSTPTVLPTTVV